MHVVGAGLAGLACAVRLVAQGREVVLYESANQAGGRARSYFDRTLGRTIDNGNHLLLSGNRSALAYLRTIESADSLLGPDEAVFPFVDLERETRWTVAINRGRLPWWLLAPARRVPGTRLADARDVWRLARADADATVGDCLCRASPLWRTFWDPLARAVLNTPPETGSARLLWAALRESFALGGRGCRPLIARESLAGSLVEPALAYLAGRGATVRFGQRLRALGRDGERAAVLDFGERSVEVDADEQVVLALPPGRIGSLLPEIAVPEASHAIVNGHFVLSEPVRLPAGSVLLGVIGGTAQWIFVRGELASLTVSAADDLVDAPSDEIVGRLWADTARALGLPANPRPRARIVKEKRATFAQTPAAVARRPGPKTPLDNLFLAGDWTDTGLPATIEGAMRSGQVAAGLVLNQISTMASNHQ